MTAPAPVAPAQRFRLLLIAIGMVGSPLGIAAGNLVLPTTSGSPAPQLATIDAHHSAYLTGSVIDAIGFALLGAIGVGVGVAMLRPRRGSTLATIAAILTLLGGIVMGAAILAFRSRTRRSLQRRSDRISRWPARRHRAADRATRRGVGAILLLAGLALGFLGGGGPLGAALTIPTLVAVAHLARTLIRVPEVTAARKIDEPIAA